MSIEDFEMDALLSAEVLVRFKITAVCSRQDLADLGTGFEAVVRQAIEDEGLWGLVDDDNRAILDIRVWQS